MSDARPLRCSLTNSVYDSSSSRETRAMNAKPPFVVFGDEWGLHPTSTQHLVRRLANLYPLLYVNTIGLRPPRWSLYDVRRAWGKARQWMFPNKNWSANVLPKAHLYSPVLVPFNTVGLIRRWNRRTLVRGLWRQLRLHAFEAPLLFVSSPIGAEVVGAVGERLLIYYVTDQYADLPGVYRDYIEDLEQTLLAEADLIFVTSVELQREKSGRKTPALLLPHAVDFEHFHSAAEPLGSVAEELRPLPRPLLGFFGLLAPWVDVNLLEQLARAFPEASVVLIGPRWSDCPVPKGAPNLHWLGPRSYEDLPRYAAHFDVGLIPFRQDRLTACVNPLKLLEYLALGLPVVSMPLPDLGRFADVVYQADTPEDFVGQVKLALTDCMPERRQQRFTLAAGQSWEARVTTLQHHIESTLRQRMIP
jgi:glycosyltransferase involved in cell wall biosynthesis